MSILRCLEGWCLCFVVWSLVGSFGNAFGVPFVLKWGVLWARYNGLSIGMTVKLILLTITAHCVSHLTSCMGFIQKVLCALVDQLIYSWLLLRLLFKFLFNQSILKQANIVGFLCTTTFDWPILIWHLLIQILNHLSILV